jgi:serine/threonine-protein kinase
MQAAVPVPNTVELLTFLQEHGFLTPLQQEELRGRFSDARALARTLLERNWLTPYQANQLLQGRGQDLLLGPYRILDRLGEGGMGQVFKAHHVSMDRTIALKMIPKERMSDPTAVGRFQREVRAVAKLSHPNIVIAFEVNQAGQTPFLAMEYVDGVDLARLVQQSGPLTIPRACEYIRQAAIGLQHAHEKGLVHRDIKPGNLMVARPNPEQPPVIKILDFGLARFESDSVHAGRLTQLGKVVGTVDYMAPEQAQDARNTDIRADIYSLGCSLFYLLTGKPPFPGEDVVEKIGARLLGNIPLVRQSRPEVSPALERVLAKMMAPNPGDRYQTPGEAASALAVHTRDELLPDANTTAAQLPSKAIQSLQQRPQGNAIVAAPDYAFGQLISNSFKDKTPQRRRSIPVGMVLAGLSAVIILVIVLLVCIPRDSGPNDAQTNNSNRGKPLPAPPLITSLSPTTGSATGGTAVRIIGTGFQPGSQVFFNNAIAKTTSTPTATSLTAVTPPLAIGKADVKVTNPDGQASVLSGAFNALPQNPLPNDLVKVYLADCNHVSWVGWGLFGKYGKGPWGRDILSVNGVKSPKDLFTHPRADSYSSVKYNLDGMGAVAFETKVAISDSADAPQRITPLTFQVVGDGNVLWASKPTKSLRQTQHCRVNVEKTHVLELRVNCPGTAHSAHAVWLDPCVLSTMKLLTPPQANGWRRYLSDLNEFDWMGLGELAKYGKGVEISVVGVKFPKGLSTHPRTNSSSIVKYTLDGLNAVRFEANVAINDAANDGSYKIRTPLTFQVFSDGNLLWSSEPMQDFWHTQGFNLNVEKTRVLELRVNCPGPVIRADAVWLDPCLFR